MLDHGVTDDHLEVVQGTIEIDYEVVSDEYEDVSLDLEAKFFFDFLDPNLLVES